MFQMPSGYCGDGGFSLTLQQNHKQQDEKDYYSVTPPAGGRTAAGHGRQRHS
jgi:hypothetical protein